jgi:5,10-methylenetetrahydromethanopterin reductase
MNKEISIAFRSEVDQRTLEKTAQAARRYDFAVISVYEDLGDPSPMYPLMTFARTIRVQGDAPFQSHAASEATRFGPACIVVPKYPSMDGVVGEIARLDNIAPGRTYLGLAAGAWMDAVGLPQGTVQQVREAAEVSRYLLEKRDDGYAGDFYTVQPGFTLAFPTPETRVPFLIGAWGANMVALAGEIADEIKIGGSVNPAMVPIIRSRLTRGAEKAGRSVDDIGIVLGAVTVVDENRQTALAVAREKAAIYIEAIGEKDPTAMADFSDEIRAIKQAVRQGDIATAVANLPDALADRFVFAGTPHDIIKKTEEIFAAGASRVEFGTPHGIDEIEGVRLLGEKVLPYFK